MPPTEVLATFVPEANLRNCEVRNLQVRIISYSRGDIPQLGFKSGQLGDASFTSQAGRPRLLIKGLLLPAGGISSSVDHD